MTRGDPVADREQAHLLIRRHPESGVDALFVNPIYTTRLADRDGAASANLLARLYLRYPAGVLLSLALAGGRRHDLGQPHDPALRGKRLRWLSPPALSNDFRGSAEHQVISL